MKSNEITVRIEDNRNLLDALLKCTPLEFNSPDFQIALSDRGGVYLISEKIGNNPTSVYVGQSKNLRNRIYRNHLMGSRRSSTLKRKMINTGKFSNEDGVKNYLREQCMVQFVAIEDELSRNSFEHFTIAILEPKYND